MASIFQISNERVRDINRNTYDLSFQNNLTMKFGALYPVMLAEVLPGDTWKIKPTFALEFLPLVFPVQTRMKANLHAFYVRRRTLWKDFMDFMGDNGENVPPYLDFNANFEEYTQTGRLGDYMGLPTTIVGDYGNQSQTFSSEMTMIEYNDTYNVIPPNVVDLFAYQRRFFNDPQDIANLIVGQEALYDNKYVTAYKINFPSAQLNGDNFKSGFSFKVLINCDNGDIAESLQKDSNLDGLQNVFGVILNFETLDGESDWYCMYANNSFLPRGVTYSVDLSEDKSQMTLVFNVSAESSIVETLLSYPSESTIGFYLTGYVMTCNLGAYLSSGKQVTNPTKRVLYPSAFEDYRTCLDVTTQFIYNGDVVRDISRDTSPYYDSSSSNKDKQLKISAEPFRAYEAIYNAFYRDVRNNPFILDGKIEYNKYIPTDEGGADTTPYKLHFRNWEKDFLTTAVQSPQQGVAPLVGITNYVNNLSSDVTFTSEDGTSYKARLETTDDGQMIKSVKVDSSDIPSENLRALVDYAQSGISINDFRNVNAFQIWLETNMRHGQRFKDLIKGHYNVDVRYDELQMPEFLGGVSEDVRVNMVTQTSADTEDSPLGSYAGQATCVGTSRSTITRYCDEPGYIMCILSVTPVPNYSQLLPKHFIKRDVLDIFTPEFGHIGFQPIKYNEVCPVQAYNSSPDELSSTFGYQRAWYDYLARVDEVHGLFRTELRNYLITRIFDLKPQLSEEFLLVDPSVTNQVFANTTENDDKILGQIYFDVKVKRPIPLYGIPRLE